jgi:hypothetical protein
MPKRTVPVLALVILLAPLGAAAQSVQPPANPLAPRDATGGETKGSGIIRGRVTSLESGRPLRRAKVQLSSPVFADSRVASTNTDGHYEFRDLPAGRFTLRVTRSGYLPLAFGQRRVGEVGRPFELAEKQVAEKVDFALPRMGVISGRVLDELGEPIANSHVWAMQVVYFQGARRLVPMSTGLHATSDDTGQYRVLGLPPGDYMVMAQSRETWPLDTDPKQILTYAPSYYPGTALPAEAQRVKVAAGQEQMGIDFALVPGRTAKVTGSVVSATGEPVAGEAVGLHHEVLGPNGGMVGSAGSTRTNGDGSFTLNNVAPGEYQINVRTVARGDRPALQAVQPLTISGPDVDGLMLVAGPGGTMRGQIVTDDGSVLPANVERLFVRAQSLTPHIKLMTPGTGFGRPGEDGRFEITGVFGESFVRVNGLTGDWSLKAVEIDGRNVADEPIAMPNGGTVAGMRVVLTNRPTVLRGGLTDEKRKPVEGTVVVFSEDAAHWREGSRLVRSTRPDQNGEFSIKGLPPGDYLIAAVDYVQDGQWNDPEFLEGLRRGAERVALADAETKRVDLTLKN